MFGYASLARASLAAVQKLRHRIPGAIRFIQAVTSLRVSFGYLPCTEFTDPAQVWVADSLDAALRALDGAEDALRDGWYVAGALSYDFGTLLQGVRTEHAAPLLILGAFREPRRATAQNEKDVAIAPPLSRVGREAYADAIESLLTSIREGDVYQVNYTVPFDVAFRGEPLQLYRTLAASSRTPYCAYLEYGSLALVSLSPELFLQFDGSTLTAKPMKGTAPLTDVGQLDNPKNRAEHLMIVDLLRNDLHRICDDVRVPHLFEIERYPTFATMTSTISGTVREGATLRDVIVATFPCGSVTGAPKRSAMQHIAKAEQLPRGFYTGSLGYLSPQRRGWWNVAIRTLQIDRDRETARFDAGGGIVSESDPDGEWDEIRLKSRFLESAYDDEFAILETFRSDAQDDVLTAHLDRLNRSALAFGWTADTDAIRRRVRSPAASDGQLVRVRLSHHRINVVVEPLMAPIEPVRICMSSLRVRSADPMLRHKTSWRPLHETAAKEAAATGCFDAVFCNERGEVTEGARTNLFARIGGVLYTPPIRCGLLPGVLRGSLVVSGRAVERVLFAEDLDRADELFVGNSARGLMRAVLAPGDDGADSGLRSVDDLRRRRSDQ